jgi:polyhydroxybutyrate depolymerase
VLAAPGVARAQASLGQRRALRIEGLERSFLLFVPSSHSAGHPLPLVVVLHGAGGRGAGRARHTGFSLLAEQEGFAVVYPDGIRHRWNDGRDIGASHDDVGFVRAILDTLGRELALDPRRVYATGISNGAMFSYRLACDLPGRFAAVAPVAGAVPGELAAHCADPHPVAVLAIQGTADPLVPYAGGGVAFRRGQVLSAERSAAFWAQADGCSSTPTDSAAIDRVADGTRVLRSAFEHCAGGREVVLYTVEGGGHTWPGGPPVARLVGRVSREMDATRVIWEFFLRHVGE